MPADRRAKFSWTHPIGPWMMVNHISGGQGGHGGDGYGNGTGGPGGDGMGPNQSFNIPVGHFTMHNNVYFDSGYQAEYSGNQNGVDKDPLQGVPSAPLIQQSIHQHGDRGIDTLLREAVVEAIHDSAENSAQPRCHPQTRTKILNGLWGWALDGIDLEFDLHSGFKSFAFRLDGPADPECRILWLYGPAGAGKSAIMQTLAGELKDAGRLGGCFFFKRGQAKQGNAKRLFVTIACQLAFAIPWLRTSISQIVENDPLIVSRSIATQMQMLISDPCRAEAGRDTVTILIDGLDECEGHDIQKQVLHMIRDLFNQPIPLRFIVASRPEPHIREVFNSSFYSGHRRSLNVEQSFEDVHKYLRDEFARVYREHHLMTDVPGPWPAPDILEDLVRKSSGYFIYAVTIIKFIDYEYERPTQRLKVIQDENNAESGLAFDPLDRLYRSILGSARRQAELVPILCAIANFDLTLDGVGHLFGLEDGDAGLLLRGLHSVLDLEQPQKDIRFHHASFLDFLNNPSRSHHFCAGGLDNRMTVARCFLQQLAGGDWHGIDGASFTDIPPLKKLIPFLIELPPSTELCLLIERMDPEWIFRQRSDNIGSMLSWLRSVPSAPQDLINLWEDYFFLSSMCNDSTTSDTTCSVKHILSPSPELCRVLVATVFTYRAIWVIPRVLDMTWDEFRTILCSVRPDKASDAKQVVYGSRERVIRTLVPLELQHSAFREPALHWIREVIAQDGVDDGHAWFNLSVMLDFCPPCDILYREFQGIPIRVMQPRTNDVFFCLRITEWLKSFPNPASELVALWTKHRFQMGWRRSQSYYHNRDIPKSSHNELDWYSSSLCAALKST